MQHLKTGILLASIAISSTAYAQDDAQCQKVHMAEPGWTDLALTSGIASVLLKNMGYEPSVDVLGLSVILEAMKSAEVDLMLGYWKPAMDNQVQPYIKQGHIDDIHQNLVGAKYTYAVPDYVYEAGVHSFNDLAKYADKFNYRVYGIEPGSNQPMVEAISRGDFGLKDWQVIESSEQGMLAQVARYSRRGQWIAFLAWAPHPMNLKYKFHYLSGGDALFGPDFGGATVDSLARKGYTDSCPNVSQLVTNLTFDVDLENEGMKYILDDGLSPQAAALKIIKKYPERLDLWLANVKTWQDQDALPVVKSALLL